MDLSRLQKELIAAARSNPPSDRVPLAFEKRVMALLSARPARDALTQWAGALWRATAPCVGITVLLCLWTLLAPAQKPVAADPSQQFERAVLVAVDQAQSSDSLW